MSSLGLAIVGGAAAAAIVGVFFLMNGAPSKEAKQSDYPTVYNTTGGSKPKRKPKRKTKRKI
jgi:hypothetical protein